MHLGFRTAQACVCGRGNGSCWLITACFITKVSQSGELHILSRSHRVHKEQARTRWIEGIRTHGWISYNQSRNKVLSNWVMFELLNLQVILFCLRSVDRNTVPCHVSSCLWCIPESVAIWADRNYRSHPWSMNQLCVHTLRVVILFSNWCLAVLWWNLIT